MSNQGPDRRRHRGQAPDPSRHGQRSRNGGPPWESGGYPDAAAWPGATDYQDPAAHQDSAPFPRARASAGYQDPGAYQATDTYQDPGGAYRVGTHRGARYGNGQAYPGGTNGGYAEPHPSGPQPLEPHPSGPLPSAPRHRQPAARSYQGPPVYQEPDVFAGTGRSPRGYAG